MFEEEYRRDNEGIHAPDSLYMEIQRQVRREEKRAAHRKTFVRYGSAAAAILLVAGGLFSGLLSPKGAPEAADQAVAAPMAARMVGEPSADIEAVLAASPAEEAEAEAAPAAPLLQPESLDGLFALLEGMGAGRRNAMITGAAGAVLAAESQAEEAVEDAVVMEAPAAEAAPAAMKEAGGDYSGTNVQVSGIDEADVVKTDGDYIYYIAGDQLVILKAEGPKTHLVSVTRFLESEENWWGYGSEMFVLGDRLMILTQGESLVWSGPDQQSQPRTLSLVYDISDRSKPVHLTTLGQSGNYVSARLADGYVYLVTSQRVWNILREDAATFLPSLSAGAQGKTLSLDSIYLYPQAQRPVYTVVSAFDLKNGLEQCASRAALGGASEIYCNGELLVTASSTYRKEISPIAPDENGKNVQITRGGSLTDLMLFSLDQGNIAFLSSGSVQGSLINQFAMDIHQDVLRLVTTVNEWTQYIYTDGVDSYDYEDRVYNCLYTLDRNLEPLGALENLAENEWVESVRFDGDIAYFVTFRQVDPLFTVDVSNPSAPRVLSSLKIPGFSEYLHGFGAGRLLGIGYNADEETGRTEGVKLSMFDTADPANVTEKHKQSVDASHTVVGYNHKAILVSLDKNIIAFPADGKYFIYAYDDAAGFALKGQIAMKNGDYLDSLRGLYIGDYLYVLSVKGLEVLSLTDFASVKTVELP